MHYETLILLKVDSIAALLGSRYSGKIINSRTPQNILGNIIEDFELIEAY